VSRASRVSENFGGRAGASAAALELAAHPQSEKRRLLGITLTRGLKQRHHLMIDFRDEWFRRNRAGAVAANVDSRIALKGEGVADDQLGVEGRSRSRKEKMSGSRDAGPGRILCFDFDAAWPPWPRAWCRDRRRGDETGASVS
jgi:hypothetical protein